MSKARTVRTIVQMAGTVAALGAMLQQSDFGIGLAWSTAILALTYVASQMAFVALASEVERRKELDDAK